jgi:hypothetical protein
VMLVTNPRDIKAVDRRPIRHSAQTTKGRAGLSEASAAYKYGSRYG